MADLDLEGFGLDLCGTDVLFAKTFRNGKNVVQALDPSLTQASLARISERDAAMQAKITQYLGRARACDVLEINQRLLFSAPDAQLLDRQAAFHDGLLHRLGVAAHRRRPAADERLRGLRDALRVRGGAHHAGRARRVHRAVAAAPPGGRAGAEPGRHVADAGAHGARRLARAHARAGASASSRTAATSGRPARSTRSWCATAAPPASRLSPDAVFPGRGDPRPRRDLERDARAHLPAAWSARRSSARTRTRLIKGFNYDDPQLLAVYYALKGDPGVRLGGLRSRRSSARGSAISAASRSTRSAPA